MQDMDAAIATLDASSLPEFFVTLEDVDGLGGRRACRAVLWRRGRLRTVPRFNTLGRDWADALRLLSYRIEDSAFVDEDDRQAMLKAAADAARQGWAGTAGKEATV